MSRARRERGVVLLVVLFYALLLAAGIATFLRRSTMDAMISRNRDAASQADALARGGLRLAEALLIEDRLRESTGEDLPLDTRLDAWAQPLEIETPQGAVLSLRIEDTGARLNLNALFEIEEGGQLVARSSTESFLIALLEKVIEEIPLPPGKKNYDTRELAANLIDFVDGDDVRERGGGEDEYYQEQDPPYRAANRPLLSPDELRLVEGFDRPLVEALLPYVSVYPHAPGGCDRDNVGCGINLNTAPPHVLALLYYDDGVELRLAPEDVIRQVLKLRAKDELVCPAGQSEEGCTPIGELVTNAIFPPPTFSSNLFVVTAEARVGEVRRTLRAVVDRSQGTEMRLLSWQAR
jgi:general secretion pathway protein K